MELGSITISELPVLIDWQFQLREFLETRLPVEHNQFSRWIQDVLPGNPLNCDNAPDYLQPPYPPLPKIRVGELQWPSGASRYARALYAVDWQTMKQIAKISWGFNAPEDAAPPQAMLTDVPSNWGGDLYPIQLRIAGEEIFQATMYPLAPYRVTGHGVDLWLLPLVDRRYQWQRIMFTSSHTTLPTWSQLLDDVSTALGESLSWTVDSRLGSPDERLWKFSHQPAAKVMDIATLSIGSRFTFLPTTNTAWVRGFTSSLSLRGAALSKSSLLAGGTTGLATRPTSIDVYCRNNEKRHVKFTKTLPDGSGSQGHSFTWPIWCSWRADLASSPATDDFVTYLKEIVNGWLPSGGQYSFAGPVSYVPTGFDDYMSIELYETEPGKYFFGSRVHELPSVFLPSVVLVNGKFDCSGGDYLYGTVVADVAKNATGTLSTAIGNVIYANVSTQQTFQGEVVPIHYSSRNTRWEFLDRCERHFQYTLLTEWYGGLAIALRKSMDGVSSGMKVVVRDPLNIYGYQSYGDRGYMTYTVEDRFYATDGPCGSAPTPPVAPIGRCETSGDCINSTQADCVAIGGTWTAGVTC